MLECPAFVRDHGLFCLFFVIILYLTGRHSGTRKYSFPFPPGPPKLPFIGNALAFPSGFEWETFHRWSKAYHSDILHLDVVGTSIIVLNSAKAIKELLERRSSLYSNRPKFSLVTEIMGFSWLLPFMPYGPAWKQRRQLLQRHFHAMNNKPLVLKYGRELLIRLLDRPEAYMAHVRHAVGASLLSLTYGIRIGPSDPLVTLAEEIAKHLADSATPVTILFDKSPVLMSILAPFFPLSVFGKSKKDWEELIVKFRDDPVHHVRKLMLDGIVEPSFVSKSLEELSVSGGSEKHEEIIKDVAGVVFIGGSGTTNSILHTFFLAMTLFPDAQAKAHDELDQVVGHGRLPDFDDEPKLPYIGALLKEVHRWKPSGPFGIPRFLEKDDTYSGYLLPGQSIIIANIWAILYNEEDYFEPSVFRPERYLKNGLTDTSIQDPAAIIFGFGRRSCPGIHIAQSTLWIILSVFEISAPVDANGVEILPSGEYHSAMPFQPVPFKCTIKPRHPKAEVLIREVLS